MSFTLTGLQTNIILVESKIYWKWQTKP